MNCTKNADFGCNVIGIFPTKGYCYDNSVAEIDGELIGVALDDINEDNITDVRIAAWVELVKSKIEKIMSHIAIRSMDLKPFLNHVYELKKSIRQMALYIKNLKSLL